MIELLISISIIAVLMSLLLPAIQSARSAARLTQCKNNLRQIGIAMTDAAYTKRRYPASGTFSATSPEAHRSWVHEVLPGLDQVSLFDRWNFSVAHDSPENRDLADIGIPVLVCPDDETATPGRGNLSYAVNGGFGWTEPVDCPSTLHLRDSSPVIGAPFDLNGDGLTCTDAVNSSGLTDRQIYFKTGFFFVENEPLKSGTSRHHTPDDITDGLSNTILIAESIRSGFDPAYPEITGWSCPEPLRNSFFLSGYVCKDLSCALGQVDYRNANSHSQDLIKFESLNSALTQAEGQAPWPSSFHTGGLNILFADGRVQFVSDSVDGLVYAAAVSPQGDTLKGPLAQPIGSRLD